jgi:hypothetical protein
MNPHSEERRTLAMAVDALADPIANAAGWYQKHLIDVHDRLYDLWAEADHRYQVWESEAPRRGAETRIAYHVENDTLDLY